MNTLPALSQLPAHLAHLAQHLPQSSLAMGISSGGHPRISIKGSRFRLQQPSAEEFVVPQLFLDVIIVDQNPHGLSKIFYAGAWDPASEGESPDCFSDNGIGPSERASKPQHSNCAACPNNVWGSKISEASGKPIKACADVKKLAVLLAANPSGPVFELRVPGDSLKNLAAYANSLEKHGIPYSTVITRLTFDTNVSHQRIIFTPAYSQDGHMPYINQEQAASVSDIIGSDEVDQCTGKKDKVFQGGTIQRTTAHPIADQAVGSFYQNAPSNVNTGAPHVPTSAPVPPSAPAAAVHDRAPEPVKRARRTPPQPPTGAPIAPLSSALAPPGVKSNPAADVAPLTPTGVTNAALDDTIAKLMNL